MLILLRKLAKRTPAQVSSEEVELYLAVASAITVEYMESQHTMETMDKLLDLRYLWPENEEEDESRWEEETPPGYESEVFISYYYFSYVLLREAMPLFTAMMNGNDKLAPAIAELLLLLEPEGAGE
ncbi:hypothetical protein MKY48_32860 [Paenibacillus sp. FSL W8-0187]|uniref:hypothetical protein n=1 Tax=unclassified Paenibacillus TaxID=185978 RepID=UPI0030DC0F73